MAIGLWQTCSTNILRVNQKLALAKNIFGGNCNFIVQIDRSRISKISLTENADKLTLGRIVKRVLLIPRTSQSKQFDDHLLANEIVRNAYSFLVIIFGKRLFFLRHYLLHRLLGLTAVEWHNFDSGVNTKWITQM